MKERLFTLSSLHLFTPSPLHPCNDSSKFYLQRRLQATVVGQRRANLAGVRRADVCVGESEIWSVEEVVGFEPKLKAQLFGDREAFGQRSVHVEIARGV